MIQLLKQLTAIPSFVDDKHNEAKLTDFIVEKLRKNKDLVVAEQKVEGGRRNLIVTDGGKVKVVLFGHMDTVMPKKQTNDPLVPDEKDGKLYGLGAVDMKSGLAVMLDIAINGHKPGVGYVFSVDEEYDFKGARMLAKIRGLQPEFIVNLEPTGMKILNGCRGICEFEFEVWGRSAHAGRKDLGINAIEGAVKLVEYFEEKCQENDPVGMKTSVNLAYLHGGLKSDKNGEIVRMGNIVPNFAKVVVEVRIANETITAGFVEQILSKRAKKLALGINRPKFKFFLGSMLTATSDLKPLERAIKEVGLKCEYADINQTGYYEVQMLQSAWNCKAVIFGATPMEKAHAENEYVEIESVEKLREVVEELVGQIIG